MSKTKLHKEKARCKHGEYGDEFKDYPFKVKKYYDRHCGSRDEHIERQQKREKQEEKDFKHLKNEIVDK